MTRFLFAASLLLFLGACTPSTLKKDSAANASATQPQVSQPASEPLTQMHAQMRAKSINHLSYALWFGLDGEHDDYEGRAVIRFTLKEKAHEANSEVRIDFEGGTLKTLTLQGTAVGDIYSKSRFDGHHIFLKMSELSVGANRIQISYTHPYSHNGTGLHRFKDPVDGQVYIYSNFEPYDAHRMFPCFDQPDLKASYELTVESPETWQVVSNTMERDVTTVDGRKSWQFPPSPVFSTYVFAMHAGPYVSWESDANGIPIRLFARKSIAQYVDHAEWLEVTQQGLQYYSKQFGYPYPFSKYDQIIVPDFNAGAMENVGAVTFSERYVPRSKITEDRKRGRADTILHEMAHMWFGDLVTMKWWNGLWLNESFATFMAAQAVDGSTRFKGSWQGFFAGMKQWAYWEDQLITTHPIEGNVPDTDQAFANFDGITYGKGASTLKQLNYFLGDATFKKGLQLYFIHHAYKNTTLADFIGALSEASGRDLSHWQQAWLQTAGVNTIEASWSCGLDTKTSKSTLSKFVLLQKSTETSSPLRPHRTQIALYYSSPQNGVRAKQILDLTYEKAETPVPQLIGKECPTLVFPNQGDYDYVNVDLDPVSLSTTRESLAKIDDPFARQMLWHTLWEMVRSAKLPAAEFLAIVRTQAAAEKDTQVLKKIFHQLASSQAGTPTVSRYLSDSARPKVKSEIESYLKARLLASPPSSDLQLVEWSAFLSAAAQPESLGYLAGILTGTQKLPGFAVEQDRRWEIIQALARNGFSGSRELIQKELKSDPSDMGSKESIAAEASIPDLQNKKDWMRKIARSDGGSAQSKLNLSQLREAMGSFNITGQEQLTKEFANTYFEILPKLIVSEDEEYYSRFADEMYPTLCDSSIIRKTTEFLDRHLALPPTVSKALRIGRQEEERCLKAREKSSANL